MRFSGNTLVNYHATAVLSKWFPMLSGKSLITQSACRPFLLCDVIAFVESTMSRIASPLLTDLNITAEERERLTRETRGPLALGMIFSFWGLSLIVVSLRIFVRVKLIKRPGLDDYIVAVCQILTTVMTVFISRQVYYGDGKHLLVLTIHQADNIARMNFVAVVCWTIAISGTKVSILIQYLRLFRLRKMTRYIWILLVIISLAGIITFVVVLLACIPLQALWDTNLRSRSQCLNQRVFWYFQSGFEVLTCFIMVSLLVPPFWNLQLPKSKRVGLIILLSLSSSTCITSVLRMKATFDALPANPKATHDFTWTGIFTSIWAATELNTAIICCSLPALMPLRAYLFPRGFRISNPRHHAEVSSPPPLSEERKLPLARPAEVNPTPSRPGETRGIIERSAEDSAGQSSSEASSSNQSNHERPSAQHLAVPPPAHVHQSSWGSPFRRASNRNYHGIYCEMSLLATDDDERERGIV